MWTADRSDETTTRIRGNAALRGSSGALAGVSGDSCESARAGVRSAVTRTTIHNRTRSVGFRFQRSSSPARVRPSGTPRVTKRVVSAGSGRHAADHRFVGSQFIPPEPASILGRDRAPRRSLRASRPIMERWSVRDGASPGVSRRDGPVIRVWWRGGSNGLKRGRGSEAFDSRLRSGNVSRDRSRPAGGVETSRWRRRRVRRLAVTTPAFRGRDFLLELSTNERPRPNLLKCTQTTV